jgi:hypothetical protein
MTTTAAQHNGGGVPQWRAVFNRSAVGTAVRRCVVLRRQCSRPLALGETSITRNARASRTKRRAASRWSSAIVAAARPCAIRPAACQLDYADCGNLKDARANNFQPLSCFCQTCRTPILVLVTLPSSSLSDTHR